MGNVGHNDRSLFKAYLPPLYFGRCVGHCCVRDISPVRNTPATFLLVQLKFILVEIFLTSNIINKVITICWKEENEKKFSLRTGQFGSTDLKVPLSHAIIIFSRSYVYIFSFHRKIYLYDNLKHLIFPFWN